MENTNQLLETPVSYNQTNPVSESTPISSNKTNNSRSVILYIVIAVLLFGMGILSYEVYTLRKSPPTEAGIIPNKVLIPTSSPQPTQTINSTADWKAYTSSKFGFTFSYPNNFSYIYDQTNSYVEKGTNGAMILVQNYDGTKPRTEQSTDVQIIIYIANASGQFNLENPSGVKTTGTINGITITRAETTQKMVKVPIVYFDSVPNKIAVSLSNPNSVSNALFDQILSTFKFTNNSVSVITPTTAPTRVKILDTSSWIQYQCGPISYKLPTNFNQKCADNPDGTQDATYGESGKFYGTSISIRKYDGGSRRQYWISTMTTSSDEVAKYVRFQESQYGSVTGLDVFASGGWWQGGYASAILIANGKTIVWVHGNQNFEDQTNKITRDETADSIASTIRFTSGNIGLGQFCAGTNNATCPAGFACKLNTSNKPELGGKCVSESETNP